MPFEDELGQFRPKPEPKPVPSQAELQTIFDKQKTRLLSPVHPESPKVQGTLTQLKLAQDTLAQRLPKPPSTGAVIAQHMENWLIKKKLGTRLAARNTSDFENNMWGFVRMGANIVVNRLKGAEIARQTGVRDPKVVADAVIQLEQDPTGKSLIENLFERAETEPLLDTPEPHKTHILEGMKLAREEFENLSALLKNPPQAPRS